MLTAYNSGGSINKGPSEGLRMLQKESAGDAGECLGRGDGVKSKEMSALQISLVLFKFSFSSLLLSEETHQVKEKHRDNAGEAVNLTILMLLNI